MHILGKVLLWLCVILLIPASLVLSTMVLDVRQRWLTDVADRQKRVEEGIQQIADMERRVRLLEEKRQSLVHDWGDVWTAPNSQVQPGTAGGIELGIGSSAGLPHRGPDGTVDPSIYVFAETLDGTQYLGEFVVTDIRPNQAVARLARTPYPQETINWPFGTYHVRGTLPSNWLTTTADLQAQQVIADATLTDQKTQLAIRNELVKASQATLNQRMAELNGDPKADPEAGDEVKDGLIETLRKYETQRNLLLAEVDRLRHSLVAQYNTLQDTLRSSIEKSKLLYRQYREESDQAARETTSNAVPAAVLPSVGSK